MLTEVSHLTLKVTCWSIVFSDNFIALHEPFFREHLLDHHLALGESESRGTVIAFPAAPNGNSAEISRLWSFAPRRPALPPEK